METDFTDTIDQKTGLNVDEYTEFEQLTECDEN